MLKARRKAENTNTKNRTLFVQDVPREINKVEKQIKFKDAEEPTVYFGTESKLNLISTFNFSNLGIKLEKKNMGQVQELGTQPLITEGSKKFHLK